MKKLLLFLSVLLASSVGAQTTIIGGGGGGFSSGSAASGCTAYSLVYVDSSGNLACALAPVNGSVTTAGRGIFSVLDTISGASATSNFLNITGAFPATLSAAASGAYFSTVLDNDAQNQSGVYSTISGSSGSAFNAAVRGEVAASGTGAIGVYGNANASITTGIGVWGNRGVLATNSYGGYFSIGAGAYPTGLAALGANNGTAAENIFVAMDNSTAVFTIADGGAITHTGPSLNTTTLGVSGGIVGTGLADNSYGLWLGTNNNANSVIFTAPSLTPDPGYLGSGTTSNSWHIGESQDRTFDFNNGSCGTSTCTDPGLIIHSAVQDTTQYNHLANWGQAGGAIKTLTESAATSVVRIPVAALEGTGGKLTYRVKAADATDVQIREGEIRFAIVNKAGTETCTLSGASEAADGSVVAASVGTLTYGITCDTTPANAVDIQFNAVSSLTQTTLNIQYFVTLTGVGQPARQ